MTRLMFRKERGEKTMELRIVMMFLRIDIEHR